MKIFLIQDSETYEELVDLQLAIQKLIKSFNAGYGGIQSDSTVEIVQPDATIIAINVSSPILRDTDMLDCRVFQGKVT